MRLVLVDHHDSYTNNLAAQLMRAGAEVRIVSHDDDALLDLHPSDVDGLVLSPGPGTPLNAADIGHTPALLDRMAGVPVLGVCLGHQILGLRLGGEVIQVRPRHGHLSDIDHDNAGVLAGLTNPFRATRYHSLAVRENDAARFRVTARAEDGTVMALEGIDEPWSGVQFHPESIATTDGDAIIKNWLNLVAKRGPNVVRRRVPGPFDPAVVFQRLYGEDRYAFWVDVNAPTVGGHQPPTRASQFGVAAEVVSYTREQGLSVTEGGTTRTAEEDIWQFLAGAAAAAGSTPLPGGYVGYLGYDCRDVVPPRASDGAPAVPDAQWLRVDRVATHDPATGDLELAAIVDADAEDWLAQTAAELEPLRGLRLEAVELGTDRTEPSWGMSREHYLAAIGRCREFLALGESYEICLTDRLTLPPVGDPLRLYLACRQANPTTRSIYLRFGDIAVCSTTPEELVTVSADGVVRARPIKGTARRGATPDEDAELVAGLTEDPKTRAENLMIVDLLRHDLNGVCVPGSVAVPGFLEVETYATVHQLVSTVTGRLRPDLGPIDAVRSCFPPGSMTGAPKERTMAIIDTLETSPRGIYSGGIGIVGADGSVDLRVVIRTAVCTPESVTIGTGGAILFDSDPQEEYAESRLKADSLLRAYAAAEGSGSRRRS